MSELQGRSKDWKGRQAGSSSNQRGRQQQQRKKHLDEEGGLGVSQKGGRGGRGDKTQTIDYLNKNHILPKKFHKCVAPV